MDFLQPEFWSFLWDGARYEALVEELGPWAPLLAIGAMIIVSFLPLPAETVAVANGMAFGQAYGFVLTWIGAMTAAALAFALARTLAQPLIYRFIPEAALRRFEQAVEKRGAPFLLLVRMIPLIPYTVVNYGSGMAPVRFHTFLWTSALGMAPPIFAFVSIGALMVDQPWLGWMMLGAAILFVLLLGWTTRRWWWREA
ncbi:MAG: VTT domain-containing protein [Pseudomonadota bacterium]